MIDQYIRQYGKRLYGLCLSLCANIFEADDLYQDTWLRVIKSLSQYDPSREFEPWLTKICVNTYRNTLRRIARSPLLSFQTNEEKDALLCAIPAPENPNYGALYEAIERLPEKLRVAVILFYFQDMDTAATAKAIDIPEGTVKSRLSKARRQIMQTEAIQKRPLQRLGAALEQHPVVFVIALAFAVTLVIEIASGRQYS